MVGGIIIARDNQAPAGIFQAVGIVKKVTIEIQFILQTFIAHLAVGEVYIKKNECAEIELEYSPLIIVARHTDSVGNGFRRDSCPCPYSGVAFFDAAMRPVGFIARYIPNGFTQLVGLQLRLLNAEDISIQRFERLPEVFFQGRPPAVYIP